MADHTAAAADSAGDMDSKIRTALRSRVSYFREQADSLTFVGVRRLLEEDLGLEMYALDPHKKFVKSYLEQCLEAANDDQPKKKKNESNTTGSQTMEDSPVLGLLTDNKKGKGGKKETGDTQNPVVPSEAMIKEAISKKASHLRENSGSITGAGVRRLLEEDLKLEKFALDSFKRFVSDQITEVFSAPGIPKKVSGDGKRKSRSSHGKASNDSTKEELSGSSENESEEFEENDEKARKGTPKGKVQGSAGPKKRKRAELDKNDSKKKIKVSKTKSEENSDKDGDDVSDDNSESSAEKTVQKKEVAKPSYGKRVEHLKSVIKSCGMSVPPSVYKKVKLAPENKREATLIKELEELLQKEGLSSNPSEKDIKEVKKRKDRAKDLEGIDMSNIVFSSRRRSTSSFVPSPKPKTPVKNVSLSSDDDDDDGEDEDDDNEDVDNDEGDNEEVGEEEEGQDNEEDDDEDGQSVEDEEED